MVGFLPHTTHQCPTSSVLPHTTHLLRLSVSERGGNHSPTLTLTLTLTRTRTLTPLTDYRSPITLTPILVFTLTLKP